MKVINSHWFPLIEHKLLGVPDPSVKEIVFVYEEEAEAAGFYDPDTNRIVVNFAPNCLAAVAKRYKLPPLALTRVALAVYFEECAHSRGVVDETEAEKIAARMVAKVPDEDMKGTIIGFINYYLEKSCAVSTANHTK